LLVVDLAVGSTIFEDWTACMTEKHVRDVSGSLRRPVLLQFEGLLRDQRVLFVLIGGVNTVVGLAWFFVLHHVFGNRIDYMETLVMSYALGMVSAFVLHRRFVFKVRGQVAADFFRFVLVTSGGLAVNAALLPVLIEIGRLAVLPAQVVATALTVVLTFFAHRSFSFRRLI